MEVLYPRCAGLDVHSRCVNACARIAAGRKVTTEHREFATTTAGLLELAAWLTEAGCTHVAMEATGVYWKPVWHVLEDEASFTLVLANAQHIRNVPGRKSDRKDAAWIADLLAHGLIPGSFVPPAPIQELRDLTRTRKQLVREIARHTLRLQKTLEDANVKLTRVASDILGVSGRAILAALIAGETDPERLADCTKGRLKADRADIVAAVHGRVTAHHRFLLKLHLAQIDALTAAVQQVEQQVDEVLRPFREAADRLATMPGVSETVARVIIAEVGVDMTQFPSAGHLVSWAGLCPAPRRECGEAPLDPDPSRDSLVEDSAGPGRVGGDPEERELSAGAVSTPQRPARPEEGDRGGRRLHADRRLLHASRREGLPRPWRPVPGEPRQAARHPEPAPASAEPWRRGRSEGRLNREGALSFFLEHFPPCSWAFALTGAPSWVRRTGGQHSPPPVFGAARAASPA